MTDTDLILGLTDQQVVAATIWGEARSEHVEGRIAIANVISNRVKAQRHTFGLTPREVCLKPWQFSCWKKAGGEENYAIVLDACRHMSRDELVGPMLRECLYIANGVLANAWTDSVSHATHYLTADLYATRAPLWTVGLQPVARIHAHLFFSGVA